MNNLVSEMLTNFKLQNVRISLKVHFLHHHLSYFPANCGLLATLDKQTSFRLQTIVAFALSTRSINRFEWHMNHMF